MDEDEDVGSERGGFRGLGVGKMAIWLSARYGCMWWSCG